MDVGRVIARCPRCEAPLSPPETTYDADGARVIDGPSNWWCPCCGYEDPIDDDEEEEAP